MRCYRQVFIAKAEPDEGDARPSDFQPIAAASVFNRIICNAMLLHPGMLRLDP